MLTLRVIYHACYYHVHGGDHCDRKALSRDSLDTGYLILNLSLDGYTIACLQFMMHVQVKIK